MGNHVPYERIDFLKDPGNEPRDGVACFSRARACVCLSGTGQMRALPP